MRRRNPYAQKINGARCPATGRQDLCPIQMKRSEPIPPELAPGSILSVGACRKHFAECGCQVKIFRGCRLICPERIRIGDYSQIDEQVFLFGGSGIAIGRYCHLAFGSSISGGGRCVIGNFVSIGAGVRILTGTDMPSGNGLLNPTVPAKWRSVERTQTIIGDHAVLFTNTVIFPGVEVGEGAVASAGSLIHQNLKPWVIYAGTPLVQVGIRPREILLEKARKLERTRHPSSQRL